MVAPCFNHQRAILLIIACFLFWLASYKANNSIASNGVELSTTVAAKRATSLSMSVPTASPMTYEESLVIIVQGENNRFPEWYDRIQNVTASYRGRGIMLVYGSFDTAVNDSRCEQNSHRCRSIYIPKTTWTEGRNLLAEAVHSEEERRNKKFLYWIFSDDDVAMGCLQSATELDCWKNYFEFVELEATQTKAPVVALSNHARHAKLRENGGRYVMTDSYDAILNAYLREQVPILLPYATLPQGASWWLSQAVHFRVMRACFPLSALVSTDLWYVNPLHRGYTRGQDAGTVTSIVIDNYGSYYKGIVPRISLNTNIRHFQNVLKLSSIENVSQHVERQLKALNNACAPLALRFDDWLNVTKDGQ